MKRFRAIDIRGSWCLDHGMPVENGKDECRISLLMAEKNREVKEATDSGACLRNLKEAVELELQLPEVTRAKGPGSKLTVALAQARVLLEKGVGNREEMMSR